MFPNPFFAAMGGPFGAGLNNMGGMPGQGMPGQMGQGMPGQMGQSMPGQMGQGMPGQMGQGMSGQMGQGMPGQMGQGMPGFMGNQGMVGPGIPPGTAGPMGPMTSAHEAQGAGGGGGGGGVGGGAAGGCGGGGRQGSRQGVCTKFMQTGSCSYGDNCKYAHVPRDTREGGASDRPNRRGGRAGGAGGGGGGGGGGGAGGVAGGSAANDEESGGRGRSSNARKTRLCDKFMTLGYCPYGDKCTFAHGMDELRPSGPREGLPPEGPSSNTVPGPAPPSEPYPGTAAAARGSAPAGQPQAGRPAAGEAAATTTPQAGSAAKAAQEVTFVDKVRALCGVLAIGNAAALTADKPLALQTAAMSLRNANAFRENPFADSVERYIQQA